MPTELLDDLGLPVALHEAGFLTVDMEAALQPMVAHDLGQLARQRVDRRVGR